jgi:hypothetical protein
MIDSIREAALIKKILEGRPKGLYLTSEHIKTAIDYCGMISDENLDEEEFEQSVYDILGLKYPDK